jgi:cytochrome c oxidase assembly factor CtaG
MTDAAPAQPRRRALPASSRGLAGLVCAAALALLAGPSPLGQRLAGSSLVVHMLVEHALLLAAGALAAAAVGSFPAVRGVLDAAGAARAAGAAVFLAVLGAWHVPWLFGVAITTPAVHAVMHLCYLLAGFALVLSLPALGAYGRVLLLLGLQAVMVVLALAMYTGTITYPGYPASQTATAGVAMLAGMQLLIPLLVLVR